MNYIDVSWQHDDPDDPVRCVCEIGADSFETRKIEFFRDGRVDFASSARRSGNTRLGEAVVPPLSEINSTPEFSGIELDAAEFARLWQQHVERPRTLAEARRIAMAFLADSDFASAEPVLLDDKTEESPEGWVFPYQSARFLVSRNPVDGLIGNAPLFVSRSTGSAGHIRCEVRMRDK